MESISINTIQTVGMYLTGLANAVDQKILSVEQARILAQKMLLSTKLWTPKQRKEENNNAPSTQTS